jgi:DNA end-binding protein Ku
MMPLIQQLIKKQTQHWTPKWLSTRSRIGCSTSSTRRRRRSRSRRRAGQGSGLVAAPSNVINIMDALRKSVAAENRTGK